MKKIVTIPNILTTLRIALIPVFIVLYVKNYYLYAGILVTVSGITDICDGYIARKYDMITDLGKVLDPIADKLTQAVVLICLLLHDIYLLPLVVLLFFKEIMTLLGTLLILKNRNNETPYARWWGKLSTVVLYITMMVVIFTEVFQNIPNCITNVLIGISVVFMLFSFINYFKLFLQYQLTNKSQNDI